MCVKLERFHGLLEIYVSFAERTTTMVAKGGSIELAIMAPEECVLLQT